VTVIGILIYNAYEENQQSNPSNIVNTEEIPPNEEIITPIDSGIEENDHELNSENVESNLLPEDEHSEISEEVQKEDITPKIDL
jgi:hypothetical protein